MGLVAYLYATMPLQVLTVLGPAGYDLARNHGFVGLDVGHYVVCFLSHFMIPLGKYHKRHRRLSRSIRITINPKSPLLRPISE